MKWTELPEAIKAQLIREHPDQFCAAGIRPVGALAPDGPERDPRKALDRSPPEQEGRAPGVGLRISLLTLRRKLLDRDAVAFACKPLTDAIAASLGVDDDDPRLEWEYAQARTDGQEGVLVKIEETTL